MSKKIVASLMPMAFLCSAEVQASVILPFDGDDDYAIDVQSLDGFTGGAQVFVRVFYDLDVTATILTDDGERGVQPRLGFSSDVTIDSVTYAGEDLLDGPAFFFPPGPNGSTVHFSIRYEGVISGSKYPASGMQYFHVTSSASYDLRPFNLRVENAALSLSSESYAELTAFHTPNAAIPTPEPAIWAMMAGGFGLVGFALRGRRARPMPRAV